VSASDSDLETDGEDDDEVDHYAHGAAVASFKVNPFVDLKSAGLLDMVATTVSWRPVSGHPVPDGTFIWLSETTGTDEVCASLE